MTLIHGRIRGHACLASLLFLVGLLPVLARSEGFTPSAVAAQLAEQNFTKTFSVLPADRYCLVEFYASWCPACKHFAPTFEKLAIFLKDKHLGAGQLYIARVDCAIEVKLCGDFSIEAFPSLLLGRSRDFAARAAKQLKGFEGPRELVPLTAWVGGYFNTTLQYTEPPSPAAVTAGGSVLPAAVPRRPQPRGPDWSVADVEGATLQLWAIVAGSPPLHSGAAKRAALREVLGAWAEAHPSASCKAASGRLHASFDSLWPPSAEVAPAGLLAASPCGPPARLAWRGAWVSCAGSQPDSRGYSCGLWEMIHTMALRLPEATAAPAMLSFLTAFTTHFFGCEPCVRHFSRILASPDAAAVTDRRALAMWLWRVHNEVNERLRGVESRYGHSTSGDPAWPKELWPSAERCPQCRRGAGGRGGGEVAVGGLVSWDEEAVWAYLQRAYGRGSAPGADGGAAVSPAAIAAAFASPSSALLPAAGLLLAAAALYALMRRVRSSGGAAGAWRRRGSHGAGPGYGAGLSYGYGQGGVGGPGSGGLGAK